MRRKIISVLLCIVFVTTFMAGCSTKKTDEQTSSDNSSAAVTAAPNDAAAPAAGSGAGATAKDQPIVKIQGTKVERPEGGYKFGFTSMDNSNPFFVTILNQIKSKVEANGDTLIVADPANDVSLQITQIEDMISQGIHAIFMNPAEAEGIAPALDELKAAGIPIINYDTEVANLEDYAFSYVGSDNYNAGKVCGDDMVKNFPNGGTIIVLDSPTMNSVTDRVNGFMDAIKDHGFTVVAQQDAKGNLQQAMTISEDLLQAHSDVVAIFGGNDPTALGALAAANAAGMKDVKIYGVDGSPDFKTELDKPDTLLSGTGAQSPVSIADTSVDVLYKYLNGEQVDSRYPVNTFLINKDNLAQYGTDSWQ